MASSTNWNCNGIPQNGKTYNELGGEHPAHENYSVDCDICGLPQESSIPNSKSPISLKTLLPIALAGIVLIVGGGTTYYALVKNRCEPGLEKIEGQCIDPFLQPYEEAVQQGSEAIAIAENYQTLDDLEKAQTILTDVFTQISQIPSETLIYSEVEPKLEEYKNKREEINFQIQKERAAQTQLQEIESIAQTAREQTKAATTNTQLTAAQQKWQEALNKLKEIDATTLVGNQIQQYKSDCDLQIKEISQRIASIASQNRPQPQPQTTYRTPIPKPQVITPSYQPSPQPKAKSPAPQQTTIPSDPCAVEPKPTNCRF
jgi:DNA repair exonuclease SbcCD ATPase subunit